VFYVRGEQTQSKYLREKREKGAEPKDQTPIMPMKKRKKKISPRKEGREKKRGTLQWGKSGVSNTERKYISGQGERNNQRKEEGRNILKKA